MDQMKFLLITGTLYLKLTSLNVPSSVMDVFVAKQHEVTLKEANIGDSIKKVKCTLQD